MSVALAPAPVAAASEVLTQRMSRQAAALDLFGRVKAAREAIDGPLIFTTSFGIEDQAIGHAILSQRLDIDLVTLDLMLPDMDGLDICRKVRSTSNVPIIMLTARDEDIDKIVGLEVGADDYLTKPFNARELVARIRSGEVALGGWDEHCEPWIARVRCVADWFPGRPLITYSDEALAVIDPKAVQRICRVWMFSVEKQRPVGAFGIEHVLFIQA